MWLPLAACLLSILPTTVTFQLPDHSRSGQYQPLPLDRCLDLLTNQLSGWKKVYSDCVTMYLNHVTQSPLFNQPEPVTKVAMTTSDRQLNSEERSSEVSALYSVKRSFQSRSQESTEQFGNYDDAVSENGGEVASGSDVAAGKSKRGKDSSDPGWMSVFRRALLQVRKRRRHSLSINRALVSLADMLMSQDVGRTQYRQKAFRQHLSHIGR